MNEDTEYLGYILRRNRTGGGPRPSSNWYYARPVPVTQNVMIIKDGRRVDGALTMTAAKRRVRELVEKKRRRVEAGLAVLARARGVAEGDVG